MIENTAYYWNLITRAQNGQKNSFIEIANFYKKMVYQHALKLNGNISLAESVTNDVFLKAWQHLKYLNENSPFNLWLNGLTISVTASYYQGKNKKNNIDKTQKELVLSNEYDKKFVKLTPRERLLLILHDLEGYSVSDIMVMLDEKRINSLSKDLDKARGTFLDEKAINLIKSYSEDAWRKLTQDFEYWISDVKSDEQLTQELRLLKIYRLLLSNFLSANLPADSLLDNLKMKINEESKNEKSTNTNKSKKSKKNTSKESKKDDFKLTFDAAEIFSNPDDSKEQFSKKLNVVKKRKRFRKKLSYFLVSINLIVIFFVVSNFYKNTSWAAKSNLIASNANVEQTSLNLKVGDLLSTETEEIIYLEVPSVGTITLNPNTKIEILKTDKDNNQIRLLSGQIKLNTNTFSNRFSIFVDHILVEDIGSSSTITYLPEGDQNKLLVEKGGVNIIWGNKKIPVPENYIYNIGDFVSFYKTSSSEYIRSVNKLALPITPSRELEEIISHSIKVDGLTLWSLLNNAEKDAKKLILEGMTKYFDLPEQTTKIGILNHDFEMMSLLLEDVESRL